MTKLRPVVHFVSHFQFIHRRTSSPRSASRSLLTMPGMLCSSMTSLVVLRTNFVERTNSSLYS